MVAPHLTQQSNSNERDGTSGSFVAGSIATPHGTISVTANSSVITAFTTATSTETIEVDLEQRVEVTVASPLTNHGDGYVGLAESVTVSSRARVVSGDGSMIGGCDLELVEGGTSAQETARVGAGGAAAGTGVWGQTLALDTASVECVGLSIDEAAAKSSATVNATLPVKESVELLSHAQLASRTNAKGTADVDDGADVQYNGIAIGASGSTNQYESTVFVPLPVSTEAAATATTVTAIYRGKGIARCKKAAAAKNTGVDPSSDLSYPPFKPATYPITTTSIDRATKGNWVGKYGQAGYSLFAFDNGTDVIKLPPYVNSVKALGGRLKPCKSPSTVHHTPPHSPPLAPHTPPPHHSAWSLRRQECEQQFLPAAATCMVT
jgi:hypothetical protein